MFGTRWNEIEIWRPALDQNDSLSRSEFAEVHPILLNYIRCLCRLYCIIWRVSDGMGLIGIRKLITVNTAEYCTRMLYGRFQLFVLCIAGNCCFKQSAFLKRIDKTVSGKQLAMKRTIIIHWCEHFMTFLCNMLDNIINLSRQSSRTYLVGNWLNFS